jgi:hypothetical protein
MLGLYIHENINKYTYFSEFLIFTFSFMIIIFLHISKASCNSLIHKYTSSWSTPHSHQLKLLSFVFGENIQNIGIWRCAYNKDRWSKVQGLWQEKKINREKNFHKRDTYNLKFPVLFICLLKYIFFFLFDFYQLREIKLSFLREPNM